MNANIDISKFDLRGEFKINKSPDVCSYVQNWFEALEECTLNIGKTYF